MDEPLCPAVQQAPSSPGAQPLPEDQHLLAARLLHLYQVLLLVPLNRALLQFPGNPEDQDCPLGLRDPPILLDLEAPGLLVSLLLPLVQGVLAHPERQFLVLRWEPENSNYDVARQSVIWISNNSDSYLESYIQVVTDFFHQSYFLHKYTMLLLRLSKCLTIQRKRSSPYKHVVPVCTFAANFQGLYKLFVSPCVTKFKLFSATSIG